MDIFNRPPSISDDALQYALYLTHEQSNKAAVASLAACVSDYVDQLLPNFLWHRDAFELKVVPRDDEPQDYYLEGTMRVGDCVDDEWCTVWLLKQISAKWDVAISVIDSDGEFLLIEAADALPDWVTPSNATNRVWIYQSNLHLIPLSHISPPSTKRQRRKLPGKSDSDDEGANEDDEDFISVADALLVIRSDSSNTLASSDVQSALLKRISGYPAALKNHTHATKVYVPTDIARALTIDPTLIQKPIETFYTRDAIQLRAAHRMSRFPPEPEVLAVVKLTRTAYAQLVGQKFFPPKVFGQWKEREGSAELRWRDVGMKIAVGFEMLFQESKARVNPATLASDNSQESIDARLEALRRNPQYLSYLQNLVAANYFRGELEGSQLWKKLEENAAAVFLKTFREDDSSRPSFAVRVTEAISRATAPIPTTLQVDEDSDDWLNIDANDFENMLERTMGTNSSNAMDVDPEDQLASDQASRLKNLANKVEAFVDGKGDLNGALFDDEEKTDDEEELSDGMGSDSESSADEGDPAQRQAAMDRLVPGLQPSEYGQMPASFHKNSQKVARPADPPVEEEEPASKPAPKEPFTKPLRDPIIPRDKYDGVDSDDETDSDDDVDSELEEDQPQVVGDIEIDMGEEEDEFLEFSRQALGISDDQWGDILRDRKSRGAFIPAGMAVPTKTSNSHKSTATATSTAPQNRPPEPGPRPNVNPNLDSFEAVMKAMDQELSRSRTSKSKPASGDKGKGRAATVEEAEDEDEDIDLAMDRELRAALEGGQGSDDEGEEPMDYNLIKNFLESFKSQAGLAGPVSTLAGRLDPGWQLPRDG
ncbi:hypothetical protein MIND_00452400 [Mycena indigotica]|uniref:SGT1-domain-containing protein n=1 Tax=Mycena indigotica TaxID=2126181 RepID=A0A8H6SZ88_9AGAR|nr:uncharacterized protein MIND_00452400 [Mycena indigotica]KAF7306610.1 hypothetical protein MIND_00452400 [Mycena indigotica]